MPVLVTEGETTAGRAAITALQRSGGEVRAWVHPDSGGAASLRQVGVKVALGTLDDEGRLEGALERVHTVVHASALLTPVEILLENLATVLSAALGAGCRRLVWTSHPHVQAPEGNAWLSACAEAEALLADAPLQTVVFRCGLVYGAGDPLTSALADVGPPPQAANAKHAPLYIDDWAEAVAAADRQREEDADLHAVVALAGPQVVTLEEFCRMLGAPGAVRRALRRPGPPARRGWPSHVEAVLARDTVPDEQTLGRTGTPPAEGTQRIRAA